MQTTQEIVINVQELEPRLRHLTIFQTFDTLQEGESLIIHNNHDPKPVYYQLQDLRGDVFTWEYLEQGPEWWDIRVTKKQNTIPPVVVSEEGDIVINVPALSPSVKHATIFEAFNHLAPGKSMIVHNDHDPKPLYYHLSSEHGDIFTWEYLEQGPEWWDVKITIKGGKTTTTENATDTACSTAQKEDIILNIPELEPRLKHPTIFNTFEGLQEGESLVIHNDHDPKPVFYQLTAEYGETFTWEYLQQGPQWWDIRVTKKGTESSETIGEITAKDWRKAQVFKKYGIDFCCGGKKTVRQVCAEKGIDATKIEQELQEVAKLTANGGYTNYDEWNLDFLADYVVNTHHNYVRKTMPEIRQYAAKVAQVHGSQHPELAPIKDLAEKINAELSAHMVEEETSIFPICKKIVQAQNAGTKPVFDNGENLESLIEKMEHEHDSVGRAFDKIRELNNNYEIPADGCASYKLLYKMLADFENDLFTHIHLENNILFPKTIEIAKTIM